MGREGGRRRKSCIAAADEVPGVCPYALIYLSPNPGTQGLWFLPFFLGGN